MVEEAEEAGEVEEAEDMDVEAEDEDKFKEEI
jgi:hypothetical protein